MLQASSMQLVTIAFSHYNEKARWGLDRFGVVYRERACLPLLHFPVVMWTTRFRGGRSDRVSTRWSTPVLITDEGERLCDSSAIVRYADDRHGDEASTLYPREHRAEIEALEQRLHDRMGAHSRRVAYFHLLPERALIAALARNNVGSFQAAVFVRGLPLWSRVLRRALGIDRARAEASAAKLRQEVAQLDERIGDRLGEGGYLVGDRFSAADLTLACMLAPALLPSQDEGYSAYLGRVDELPPAARALVEEMRQTRIGQHALRMFAEERRRSPP